MHFKSLVRQLQIVLNRWEIFAIRAVSCTSLRPIRALPGVSATPNPREGRPAYEISIPQLEFLKNRMRFNWSQITRMLLVNVINVLSNKFESVVKKDPKKRSSLEFFTQSPPPPINNEGSLSPLGAGGSPCNGLYGQALTKRGRDLTS